jgi:folylpolyglutamate synthase/dihydropteroate synthase
MPAETAELAAEIFGEDRVQSAERLDDAIEIAVGLADEAVAETGPAAADGVLVTGSVITAGDARCCSPRRAASACRAAGESALASHVHRRRAVMKRGCAAPS